MIGRKSYARENAFIVWYCIHGNKAVGKWTHSVQVWFQGRLSIFFLTRPGSDTEKHNIILLGTLPTAKSSTHFVG